MSHFAKSNERRRHTVAVLNESDLAAAVKKPLLDDINVEKQKLSSTFSSFLKKLTSHMLNNSQETKMVINNTSSVADYATSNEYENSAEIECSTDMKAMSVPHGTVSTADHNEKWAEPLKPFSDKVDWTVQAVNGAHIWHDTNTSGGCMLQDCKKTGSKKRCTACKFVAHKKCIENQCGVLDLPKCRPTYREATPKGGVESLPFHHIVGHRKLHGRCNTCGKNFQSMLSYKTQREIIAQNCSWCKLAYHTKECRPKNLIFEACDLGTHKNIILPPSWVVKLPPRKYSQTNNKRGRVSMRRHSSKERRAFVIKPIETKDKILLLVFVNPKSGGNEGTRILEKYQYILNPRQVFDLSKGGPRFGLELFRKVPNIRILVCGGDGTVGWILSEIDKLKVTPAPPVAILPLGTGNDLSRFLGWGAGYTDEPLSKILTHVEEGEVQKLDRWSIDVYPNIPSHENLNEKDNSEDNSVSKLPLSVMNNYYSMGADADVCLEFHESREANPERFKSRLKNLYFYGKKGSEKIIRRKSNDLYKCIDCIICDGMDLTQAIKELKPLCLIFLNISSYSAGTCPWGNPTNEEFLPQTCDDGYLEIIALTSTSMVATQVGGHGIRISQCQSAILTTNTKISMQVDGEPCRLNPSKIHIKRRNQANMITKKKPQRSLYHSEISPLQVTPKTFSTKLYYLTFNQYASLVKYDIDEIKEVVLELCSINIDPEWQLDDMRKRLDHMKQTEEVFESRLRDEWCFLDATWTVRIYRIDEAQESLLHLGDILEGGIFVLDLMKDSTLVNQSSLKSPSCSSLKRPLSVVDDQLSMNCERKNSLYSDEKNISSAESDSDESCEDICGAGFSSPLLTIQPQQLENSDDLMDDNERINAFLDAAQKGNLPQFKRYHEAVKSLSVRNSFGSTPLHLASINGRKAIVDYIIREVQAQMDKDLVTSVIDLVDNESQTALHLAALHKKRTICRKLVKAGASVTRQDTEGNTPKLLALRAQDNELAKYLEKEERFQLIAADDHETAV